MKAHKPIELTPAERLDLASITKHPGMLVLVDKILESHVKEELHSIYEVQLDDPERVTKLDAICASAYAMKLTLELIRGELVRNWNILAKQEEERKAKNAEKVK